MSAIEQPKTLERKTVFSPDSLAPDGRGVYRYTLWREWDTSQVINNGRFLQIIGLNPSTATEVLDDPTIRRCIDFAKRWGFSALCMTNIFAYRATLPEVMKAQPDPVGCLNDHWLCRIASHAGMTLAAWGDHGDHGGRSKAVVAMLRQRGVSLYALALTKRKRLPRHPLYIKAEAVPFIYDL